MGTFVTGSGTLFTDKSAAPGQTRPAGWTDANVTLASDLNGLRDAAYDLRNHGAGWVNVTEYGAVVNTNTAANATCIDNAIAAARAASKAVYFPPGNWYCNLITTQAFDSFLGAGWSRTILRPRATNQGLFFLSTVWGVEIKDMRILGQGYASTTAHALEGSTSSYGPQGLLLQRLRIEDWGGDGVHMHKLWSCRFEDVWCNNIGGHGFFINHSLLSNTLVNCYARGIGFVNANGAGYRVFSGTLSLVGCNGIDAGNYWGIFGATVADDLENGTVNLTCSGVNAEDARLAAVVLKNKSQVDWHGSIVGPRFVHYDAAVGTFAVGQTITGGTSGATAEIIEVTDEGGGAGYLRVQNWQDGGDGNPHVIFQDDEALTSSGGATATVNGVAVAFDVYNQDLRQMSVLLRPGTTIVTNSGAWKYGRALHCTYVAFLQMGVGADFYETCWYRTGGYATPIPRINIGAPHVPALRLRGLVISETITAGDGQNVIKAHMSGTRLEWDPASVAAGGYTSTTVTVTGAAVGDTVTVGFAVAVPAGCILSGAVTATDTVTVTLFNGTAGAVDLGLGTLRADVWQHYAP